jgi:hypothetical protein
MPNVANILTLVEAFARQITATVEATMAKRMQAALAGAFGAPPKRGPGRPPKKPLARTAAPVPAKRSTRKAPKATAKLARARKLQGQYLGALRALGQADRAKVKALAQVKGVPAAVKLAASLKKPKT